MGYVLSEVMYQFFNYYNYNQKRSLIMNKSNHYILCVDFLDYELEDL